MQDEEKNESQEEQAAEGAEEQADEAGGDGGNGDGGDAGGDEGGDEAAEPQDTPEEEPDVVKPAGGDEAVEEGAEPDTVAEAEPEADLSPKEKRRRARQRRSEPHRPGDPEARETRRRRQAAARRSWRRRRRERYRAARGEARPAADARADGGDEARGKPRVRQGVVVSAKPDKTITVRIDVTRRHRTYKKIVRESATLHAHDERNDAHEGDTVRVVEARPMSRTKRWRLIEVLERAR